MNKKALWINICADDWTVEMLTIASIVVTDTNSQCYFTNRHLNNI